MLGRDAHLGACRQLVEPAVERLHREERHCEHEHQPGAEREAHDGVPHHARRPPAPEGVAPGLGGTPRERQPQPVHPRTGGGQERGQKGRRREDRDADDDDRAERHRAQRVHIDHEKRCKRDRDGGSAEDDGGPRARHGAS